MMRKEDFLPIFPGNETDVVWVDAEGTIGPPSAQPGFLLPGSFNPLHKGHRSLFAIASEILGRQGAFELTLQNADKPALEVGEVSRRLIQFRGLAPVVLTRAATFPAKARLFPGTVFVVGADTAARVISPRFYDNSGAKMHSAIEEFGDLGCSFLVAGRVNAEGQFLCLADLAIPDGLQNLFRTIPAERFRIDLSSTLLRQQSQIGL